MKFDVGNIIALVVAALIMGVAIAFFVKKKSPALAATYGSALLIYVGLYVLYWFYPGMGLGIDIATIALTVMGVAVVVVYQNEFKSLFAGLSKLVRKQHIVSVSDEELQVCIDEIVKACQTMAKARTGALIVIVPSKISQYVLDSGVELGALLSSSLLVSIFNTRAPMHDGAVVVKGNKVLAAGCFLPLSQSQSINKDVGTRHRAAMGITEESDNISIVVSEENGIISVAKKGILRRYITPERLSDLLYEAFGVSAKPRAVKK